MTVTDLIASQPRYCAELPPVDTVDDLCEAVDTWPEPVQSPQTIRFWRDWEFDVVKREVEEEEERELKKEILRKKAERAALLRSKKSIKKSNDRARRRNAYYKKRYALLAKKFRRIITTNLECCCRVEARLRKNGYQRVRTGLWEQVRSFSVKSGRWRKKNNFEIRFEQSFHDSNVFYIVVTNMKYQDYIYLEPYANSTP